MTFHSHTFHYQPDLNDDYRYPAAIMVTDLSTGETVSAIPRVDHPAAPAAHDARAVAALHKLIDEFYANFSIGIPFHEVPTGDHITCECNPDVEGDDIDAALIMLMQVHVTGPAQLAAGAYETFTIDYRPNQTEHYPLAIFSYHPASGRFTGFALEEPNPFLPRLNRQQRRTIQREMDAFFRRLNAGNAQEALGRLDRPRFGVFRIDHYHARNIHQALKLGISDLYTAYFGDTAEECDDEIEDYWGYLDDLEDLEDLENLDDFDDFDDFEERSA